ncbi:hypothetical protein TRFO_27993 [Tritrichomonas foetus]|uniref:Protein kinase domain-containing protein n=1 Tax=Tritrichomonas foetus TaxID=1144522 RepID=A0A1J4K459_9EUKA|nr:hypothetical protein TRFO_27993 [Tritrichomonas foetus]|eukprot:OHT04540.1 hypothetical protein TRFO_27993 [Tritrichomonas foetus]
MKRSYGYDDIPSFFEEDIKVVRNINLCDDRYPFFDSLFENVRMHFSQHFNADFENVTRKLFGNSPFLTFFEFSSPEPSSSEEKHSYCRYFSICSENNCIIIDDSPPKNIQNIQQYSSPTKQALFTFFRKFKNERKIEIYDCDTSFKQQSKNFIESSNRNIYQSENESDDEISKDNFLDYNEKIAEMILMFYFHYTHFFEHYSSFSYYINSIIGFKLRRFYYESYLFENPSFFHRMESFQFYRFSENDFIFIQNRSISQGSTGVIELALHLKTFSLVAIKSIFNNNNDNYFENCFIREYNFFKNYKHPFIIQCYGTVLFSGHKYQSFVIEFMCHGSLEINLKNLLLNNSCENVFLRLLFAVNYLHSNNIIHRDINPSNVLIDHNYNTFLSDFGSIKELSPESPESTSDSENMTKNLGSIDFSAPEMIIDSQVPISTAIDVYSLGMILYYLIERKKPFYKQKIDDILQSFKDEETPTIHANEIWELIYGDMICFNPIQRHDTFLITLSFIIFNQNRLSYDNTSFLELLNYKLIEKDEYKNICNNKDYYFNINKLTFIYENKTMNSLLNNSVLKEAPSYYILFLTDTSNSKLFSDEKCYYLGLFFLEDAFFPIDMEKSLYFFNLSANQNYINALIALSNIYLYCEYVPHDVNKAIHYLEKASDLNDVYSQNYLGKLYSNNKWMEPNMKKAIHYFKLSANQGNSKALYRLGIIYLSKNELKGYNYLKLSAEKENINALLIILAIDYKINHQNDDDNNIIQEKIDHFFDKNNAKSQYYIGLAYLNQYCVPFNIQKAIYYFKLSANQNFRKSQYVLGKIYLKNKYIPQDLGKSLKFFRLSASQNHPGSFFYLGKIFFHGENVKQDIQKAFYYFELASQYYKKKEKNE